MRFDLQPMVEEDSHFGVLWLDSLNAVLYLFLRELNVFPS